MLDSQEIVFRTQQGEDIRLEIASSEAKKRQGLQGRDSLEPGQGMFFLYTDPPQIRSMWMPNMKIALDIVWLDEHLQIVHITTAAQPCPTIQDCPHLSSVFRTQYAIEMSAGEAARLGLRRGQRLEHKK
jgi:uncharacterized membrane protein (UPF0127 family)